MDSTTPAVPASTSSEQPKIVLYWLEQSRAQRILWLLEELKLPYELKVFHRQPDKLAPPELKKIHPLGKSPVLSITPAGSETPIVIAESAFITEYLLEHFGKDTTLLPKRWKEGQEGEIGGETEQYMRYKYFLHYAEGSLMSILLVALIVENIKNSPVPFFIKPITSGVASKVRSFFVDPNLLTHFDFLEKQLESSCPPGSVAAAEPFLCGPHLTGVDILLSFPLIASRGRTEALSEARFPTL
ncbi:thioredoxin-like protein [Fistulina hepatica ATCC 64428]|nr:thioredoxin-like protein [Fistulina hepatica ATCC 64428]